jgi:hypothetical protein
MKLKFSFSLFFIFLFSFLGKAQNVGVGASAIYNFQTESFGAGVRVNIFPNKTISYVPQASYFFGPKIKEFTIGLGIEYKVIQKEKFNIYGLAHAGYNQWLNPKTSDSTHNYKPNNWNAELGIGISNNRCFRPFLEYRYNFKFLETHLDLGFIYIFGCSNGGSKGGHRCPAY